jgi:D-glycero-beta-D-manno-heptose-7-phosphate kinase
MNFNKLTGTIQDFANRRILVVGDAIADQFIYGEIGRVSREAPVFILRHEHTETAPGGAANCAANLRTLGANVSLVGVVGNDEPGAALMQKLRDAGVDCSGVVVSPQYRTTTKVRVLAGQTHSTRQRVIRIDYGSETELDVELREQLAAQVRALVQQADAVIISDYGYGAADPAIAETVRETAGASGIPVLVDSRFRLASFPQFTSATPNEDELAKLIGHEPADLAELETAGQELCQRLQYKALLITRGGHGMMLLEPGQHPLHQDAVGPHEPVDVTGAGDTVIATYALALASGATFAEAARLANLAGGIVVMKRGTATVTSEELLAAAQEHGFQQAGAGHSQ